MSQTVKGFRCSWISAEKGIINRRRGKLYKVLHSIRIKQTIGNNSSEQPPKPSDAFASPK